MKNLTEQYKQELERQIAFQKLLFDISTEFLDVKIEEIENSIQKSLEKIGCFVFADRSYIIKYNHKTNSYTNEFEWCREGIDGRKEKMKNLPLEEIPEWVSHHQKGLPFCIPDAELIMVPSEKALLNEFKVKSLLTVPIMSQNDCYGYLGFSYVNKKHECQELEKNLLSSFGHLLLTLLKRKDVETSLFLQKELYKTTLFSIGDGVVSFDEKNQIQFLNLAAVELCFVTREEIVGQGMSTLFLSLTEPISGKEIDPFESMKRDGKKQRFEQLLASTQNNKEILIELTISPVYGNGDKVLGSVMIFKNITEEKKKQIDNLYLSLHDYLTGLYNRRFFEEEMIRLDTRRNLPFSIIMLDLDGLKLTNDAFGHEAGDLLLRKMAEIIKSECRDDEIAARLGGDEFSILLPATNREHCDLIVKRIREACKKCARQSVVLSAAIGYATKVNPLESMDEIMKEADNNMYRNKLITGREMKSQTFKKILENLQKEYENGKRQTGYISYIATGIARAISLTNEEILDIEKICMLHNIGEIVIPKVIYKKRGKLTEDEYNVVKRHPEAGYQILKSMEEYSTIAKYVLSHHEKWDGSGYPRKLKGDAIPLYSRIIAIADSYEAMTSGRSYKKALSRQEAREEIIKNAGTSFDPDLVKIFLAILPDMK